MVSREERLASAKQALEGLAKHAESEMSIDACLADAGSMINRAVADFMDDRPGLGAILLPALAMLARARELLGEAQPLGGITWIEYRRQLAELAVDSMDLQADQSEQYRAVLAAVFGPRKES